MNWLQDQWRDVLARFREPDPLKKALKENRELTLSLCETMNEFEQTVIRYHGKPRPKYGRRAEDNTMPRGAQS